MPEVEVMVLAKVTGGAIQEVSGVKTVADVAQKLGIGTGYTATINGETAEDNDNLREHDYVTFAKSVKGGI